MRFQVLTLILTCLVVSCSKHKDQTTPTCIENKIDELEKGDASLSAIEIHRWKTQGNVYYYFVADCCDQFNYLYDEECNIICAPDGGFTGNGDGNCPYFGENIETELIWKK